MPPAIDLLEAGRMAKCVVHRAQIADGSLPSICIVCGDRADHRLFAGVGSPSLAWAMVSPLFGLLAFWGSTLRDAGQSPGGFPFCERHRNYWPRRARFIVFGFVSLLVLMGIGFAFTPRPAPGEEVEAHWMLGVAGLWLLIYLPTFLFMHLAAVRPTGGDPGSVVLSGASRPFVVAIESEQKGDEAKSRRADAHDGPQKVARPRPT
ncbi:MAG: hypothetical protein BGO49_15875 [Planctomycetales bacterium 71-10]|nr:MAG: hypothetical protein BGO49_15875 [Planctomycetales bacterium 71-10]